MQYGIGQNDKESHDIVARLHCESIGGEPVKYQNPLPHWHDATHADSHLVLLSSGMAQQSQGSTESRKQANGLNGSYMEPCDGMTRNASRVVARPQNKAKDVESSVPGSGHTAPPAKKRSVALEKKGYGWIALGVVLGLLLLVLLPSVVEAGKCVRPPRGSTAFCQIDFQVYVAADTMSNDTTFALDKRAEILTEEWFRYMGCSRRVETGEAWCKNYACALYFPECNTFKDAPMPICRQTCIDCYRTCTPDRPILPPGMFIPPKTEDRSWAKQYTQTTYDAWSKAYMCEADSRLVNGGKFLTFTVGSVCTGTGTSLRITWATILMNVASLSFSYIS